MYKKYFFIIMMCLFAIICIPSCKNDQQDKQVADSTKALIGAGGVDTTKRIDTSSFNAAAKTVVKDTLSTSTKIKNTANKKMNKAKGDTPDAIKSSMAAVAKTDNTVAKNITAPPPSKSDIKVDPNAPFVSKYGVIPRNATTSNITSFYTAFPDRTTVIKINFDGPADAEMTGVKAQIIKVLRESGYTNVQDQSATIEPKRMPKEIHYELQRDGSVILWVPVANADQ